MTEQEIMDIKRILKQLRSLRNEREDLIERLKIIEPEIVADWAKDYRWGKGRVIFIVGYNQHECDRLARLIERRLDAVNVDIYFAEQFIASIEDSETRRIFDKRFSEGKTEEQIGIEVGLERSTVSKRIKNTIDRYELSHKSQNKVL